MKANRIFACVLLFSVVFCASANAADYICAPGQEDNINRAYTIAVPSSYRGRSGGITYDLWLIEDALVPQKGAAPTGSVKLGTDASRNGQYTATFSAVDSDCTQDYTATWKHRNAAHENCAYMCKITRAAESGHDWSEWTSDADGNHTRSCKHPVCIVTQSHAPSYETSTVTSQGTHLNVCTVADCTLDEWVSCSGGQASCTEQATCEFCHEEYGDVLGHELGEWQYADENNHVRSCVRSGCDEYETAAHGGGQATTTEKAVCTECGEAYGELMPVIPRTGDGANPALWLGMLLASAVSLLLLRRRARV